MREAVHIARIEGMKNPYKNFTGKREGKRSLWRSGVGRRIILKRILNKQGMRIWTGFIWLRI
jgi:hypothetical protein